MARSKVTAKKLNTLDLTQATREDGGKLVVTGLERTAQRWRDAKEELDALTERVGQLKAKIIEQAHAERLEEEEAGRFYKTCIVKAGDDQGDVLVSWGDSYSAIDPSHEKVLRDAFTARYDDLFDSGLKIKLKPDVTLETVRTAMGKKMEQLEKLIEFKPHIKIQKNFMAERAGLRLKWGRELNRAIDVVVGQVQSAPSVKPTKPS